MAISCGFAERLCHGARRMHSISLVITHKDADFCVILPVSIKSPSRRVISELCGL